ncbi:POU domain protein [Plakobranchus ocellatus]|uniref:POU domain protein n=1 Tax=Plakobranchus ocellatus TaxID=259542 RepID=A0AAV4AQC0_9GAST|nr:POU domain protein [Plakobranchus ocellatus]
MRPEPELARSTVDTANPKTSNFFPGLDDGFLARAEAMGVMDISKPSGGHQLMKPDGLYGHTPDFTGHNMVGPPRSHQMHQMHAPHPHHHPGHPHHPGSGHHGFGPPDPAMFDQLSGSPPGHPSSMSLGPVASMAEHHSNVMAAAAAASAGSGGSGNGGSGGLSSSSSSSSSHPQPPHHQMYPPMYSHAPSMVNPHGGHPGLPPPPPHHHHHHPGAAGVAGVMHHHHHHQGPGGPGMVVGVHEADCDPRELEMFAERFKQRRIKLGVTQADVGAALANLKIPGVGCLSQSTICRFESLTLSHNNMIALKPILQTWLEDAEKQARERKAEMENGLNGDKKRKRTSIAAPEKRSLEAYFAVQPRPSGEKIAQIAEKLDLKKNVVRVWFCNQRQKQKRMKFSAIAAGMGMGHH